MFLANFICIALDEIKNFWIKLLYSHSQFQHTAATISWTRNALDYLMQQRVMQIAKVVFQFRVPRDAYTHKKHVDDVLQENEGRIKCNSRSCVFH